MHPDAPRATGLNPTLRQVAIFVLWAVLIAAATRFMMAWQFLGTTPPIVCMMVPICFGLYPMFVLVILLWMLDRKGRVRDWYLACLLAVDALLAGTLFLLQDPVCFALSRRTTPSFPMSPLLAVGCFYAFRSQWRLVGPGGCPSCGRRAIISHAKPLRPDTRRMINTGEHGWCAGCGVTYEREVVKGWKSATGPWIVSDPPE